MANIETLITVRPLIRGTWDEYILGLKIADNKGADNGDLTVLQKAGRTNFCSQKPRIIEV